MTKQSIVNKKYYVYLMMNYTNAVIYTGITCDLVKRIYQHQNKLVEGFTKKYNVNKLVYYEICDNPESAIAREKQIKAGSRMKKIDLITRNNPKYRDLYEKII